MKKLISLFLVSALLLSFMIVGVSAEVTDQKIKLVDVTAGNAPGFSGNQMHLGWANNAGLRFDVLDDEVLAGVDVRTIIAGETINIALYKWNSSLDDKEELEAKDFTSTDCTGNVYNFDKVYPKGTYYVEVKTYKAPEPRLYVYNKVITGRNIQGYQYDRTWQEFNAAKQAENSAWNFGEGFDMDIILLKGVSAKVQTFVTQYYKIKADVAGGATVTNQAIYDQTMTAIGTDLKATLKTADDATLQTYLDGFTAAVAEPQSNPATGDAGLSMYIMLSVLSMAVVALTVKKIKNNA